MSVVYEENNSGITGDLVLDYSLDDTDIYIENLLRYLDLAIVSGTDNLYQAIRLILQTAKGGIIWDSEIGFDINSTIGQSSGIIGERFLIMQIKEALEHDNRIDKADIGSVTREGDTIIVRDLIITTRVGTYRYDMVEA